MTIHSSRSMRLMMALFLGPMAQIVVLIAVYAVVAAHTPAGVLVLPVAAFLGYGAYVYGKDAPLIVDERDVTCVRPPGDPRTCTGASISRLDHAWGGRGTSELGFIGRDRGIVMKVGHSSDKNDVEAMTKSLGVPLSWDATF